MDGSLRVDDILEIDNEQLRPNSPRKPFGILEQVALRLHRVSLSRSPHSSRSSNDRINQGKKTFGRASNELRLKVASHADESMSDDLTTRQPSPRSLNSESPVQNMYSKLKFWKNSSSRESKSTLATQESVLEKEIQSQEDQSDQNETFNRSGSLSLSEDVISSTTNYAINTGSLRGKNKFSKRPSALTTLNLFGGSDPVVASVPPSSPRIRAADNRIIQVVETYQSELRSSLNNSNSRTRRNGQMLNFRIDSGSKFLNDRGCNIEPRINISERSDGSLNSSRKKDTAGIVGRGKQIRRRSLGLGISMYTIESIQSPRKHLSHHSRGASQNLLVTVPEDSNASSDISPNFSDLRSKSVGDLGATSDLASLGQNSKLYKKKKFKLSPSNKNALDLQSEMEERRKNRKQIKLEILEKDKFYIESLRTFFHEAYQLFLQGSKEFGISEFEIDKVFSNMEPIILAHEKLQFELGCNGNVGEVLLKNIDFLKMYIQYLNGYEEAVKTLSVLSCRKSSKSFFSRLLNPESLKGQDFFKSLVMPIYHILSFEKLLRELKRFTLPVDDEFMELQSAFEKIHKTTTHISGDLNMVSDTSKLLELKIRMNEQQLGFEIMEPGRRILKEGRIIQCGHSGSCNSIKSPRRVYLFQDRFLWVSEDFQFRGQIDLRNSSLLLLDLSKLESEESEQYSVSRFDIFISGQQISFECESETMMNEWICTILEAIEDLK